MKSSYAFEDRGPDRQTDAIDTECTLKDLSNDIYIYETPNKAEN